MCIMTNSVHIIVSVKNITRGNLTPGSEISPALCETNGESEAMESSTKVKCSNCRSYVIPRLIHHEHHANMIVSRKTEHVCPICGDSMYETGGNLTGIGKVWTYFILLVMALYLIFNFDKTNNNLLYYAAIALIVSVWIKNEQAIVISYN